MKEVDLGNYPVNRVKVTFYMKVGVGYQLRVWCAAKLVWLTGWMLNSDVDYMTEEPDTARMIKGSG